MSNFLEISPNKRRSQRGSVLLIVLITVALLSLLVVTLVGLQTSMEISVVAAGKLAQQEYAATGGLEIASAILEQDKTDTKNDNLFETWAQPRRCKISGYDCEIIIIDEESKIKVTDLASENEETIQRVARLMTILDERLKIEIAEKRVAEACAKMADDLAKKSLSTNSFERLMEYEPFTEEVVYGKKDATGKIIGAGLAAFVTFQNTAKVNINTASREVLLAVLDFENEELVERIIEYRETEDEDGNFYGFTDFNKLRKAAEEAEEDYGEEDILLHKDNIALITKYFDIQSNNFTITAVSPTGSVGAAESDGAQPALPARGWVWTVTRTNKGKIDTVSLRETTQPAKYLHLESEK